MSETFEKAVDLPLETSERNAASMKTPCVAEGGNVISGSPDLFNRKLVRIMIKSGAVAFKELTGQ